MALLGYSRTHLEVPQPFRYDVGSYFFIFDVVAAVLSMLAHRAGTGAFVVTAIHHLSRECKPADAAQKGRGGPHL